MGEIRLTINGNFEKEILALTENLGIKPTDYLKSLVIQDLKERVKRNAV